MGIAHQPGYVIENRDFVAASPSLELLAEPLSLCHIQDGDYGGKDLAIDITTNANNALASFLLAGIVNGLGRALYSLVGRRGRLFAGAGGNWPTINEVPVKNVFPQSNGNACGQACGQTLLKDRGISVTQVQVGEFSPRPRMDTNSLAKALTTLDTIRM